MREHDNTTTHTTQVIACTRELMQAAELVLDTIGPAQGRALLVLAGYEQGSRGECRAKVQTIGQRLGVSERQARRHLSALRAAGLWERVSKRMRWSGRVLTDLGRLCVELLLGRVPRVRLRAEQTRTGTDGSGQVSGHNGEADHTPREIPGVSYAVVPKRPDPASATEYKPPRGGGSLNPATWNQLALWMDAHGKRVSWARCKIAHRTFARLAIGLHRTREFRRFHRIKGCVRPFSPEYLVARAIQEARLSGAKFHTVEAGLAFVGAIVQRCLVHNTWPGEYPE